MVAPVSAPASIRFFVRGVPQTQGSKRVFHRPIAGGRCLVNLIEDNDPKLKEWRALIATAAKRAMKGQQPFTGAVRVMAAFWFPRPKSHTAKQRQDPFVHGGGRYDIEKLERACYDAMTFAAVWLDDAQVAVHAAEKRYAVADIPAGVFITVEALGDDEEPLFEAPSS